MKKSMNYLSKLLYKTLVCLLLFLLFLVCNRKIVNFNKMIYEKIFNSNISFAKINKWYESHFGNLFPIKNMDDVLVFNESLSYKSKDKYLDGVILTVDDNYIVPSIGDGIIIFIGEKDGYGKTIIVEDDTGLDIWYSNINVLNISLYEYVKKGDYLGEVIDNSLIMSFQKKGIIEDYKKYI